jgi:uncharacterized protein (TIGR03437 family)
MPAKLLALAALLSAAPTLWADTSGTRQAPVYSAASIVNAADNQVGPLAPNTIGTIYGTGLSYVTSMLTPNDMHGIELPTVLPGTGVHVLVGGIPANIYYVSPTQINFLVPASLLPAAATIEVVSNSLQGPAIPIQLAGASPALFQLDAQNAVATRPDGSLLTPDSPASPGGIVILYATGLGQTVPAAAYSEVPIAAAVLKQFADFKATLDGLAVDAGGILYAGLAPGFAGLYQINLRLPDTCGSNPEIRIGFGDTLSKPGLRLPVRP